jgi:hypothetical protein
MHVAALVVADGGIHAEDGRAADQVLAAGGQAGGAALHRAAISRLRHAGGQSGCGDCCGCLQQRAPADHRLFHRPLQYLRPLVGGVLP